MPARPGTTITSRYGPIDPKMPRFRSSEVHDVTVDYDYINEPEINRHPFYQEFLAESRPSLQPHRQDLGAGHDEICVLSVQRDKIYGHANRREADLLHLLGRHLSQATEIDRRLTLGAVAERSLYGALDRVPEALFLLGQTAACSSPTPPARPCCAPATAWRRGAAFSSPP